MYKKNLKKVMVLLFLCNNLNHVYTMDNISPINISNNLLNIGPHISEDIIIEETQRCMRDMFFKVCFHWFILHSTKKLTKDKLQEFFYKSLKEEVTIANSIKKIFNGDVEIIDFLKTTAFSQKFIDFLYAIEALEAESFKLLSNKLLSNKDNITNFYKEVLSLCYNICHKQLITLGLPSYNKKKKSRFKHMHTFQLITKKIKKITTPQNKIKLNKNEITLATQELNIRDKDGFYMPLYKSNSRKYIPPVPKFDENNRA